jgi:ubiquinone/menaquinone biosynthesis C-methylase UbiE
MTYTPQVDKTHYTGKYRSQERWNSYWHQLELILKVKPHTLLEVGVGEGVVAREAKAIGVEVTTLDIAEDLGPDVVGSVTDIPLPDNSYDCVLAAEILEHIKFEDVPAALKEIARVAKQHVIISIPHPGYVFLLRFKIPLLPYTDLLQKVGFFWKEHRFNGEHYWELGKKGYSLQKFLQMAREAGLTLQVSKVHADDPVHRFFLFSV